MSNDKTPEKTNDFDALRAQLAQRNLSGDKIADIMHEAGNLKSKEEAEAIISLAKAKLGNRVLREEDGKQPPIPEADLVADGGFKGYGKAPKDDQINSEKGPDKAKGKDDRLEEKKGKSEKRKSDKDEMKNEGTSHEGGSNEGVEKTTSSKGKKYRPLKSENIKKTLAYLERRKQIKDVYKDDPLKAFEELAKQKPDGQAPSYIQQKYESDRTDLLHDVDERIKTSPDGTKYSPERLGEELYKYQSNAETKAFADDVLKNNQSNEELQESYKEAANKTPVQEEPKNQETEQQQEDTTRPSFLKRLFRGRSA